jgi:hypothetical protein
MPVLIPCPGAESGMTADGSPVLAQRAVADSPRWTRALEDQPGYLVKRKESELGMTVLRTQLGGRQARPVWPVSLVTPASHVSRHSP